MAYLAGPVDGAGIAFSLPLQGNQTAITYYWWKLQLAYAPVPAADLTLVVYLDTTTLDPPAFSTTHLPSQVGTLLTTVTVPRGTPSQEIQLLPPQWYYRQCDWGGRLNLSLFAYPTALSITTAALATGGVPVDSGRPGDPFAPSRLHRCGKSWRPMPVIEMVRDGYYRGLWVRPDLYDEPEPPRPVRRRPEQSSPW